MKNMQLAILLTSLVTLPLTADDVPPSKPASSEVATIDRQIKELKQAREVARRNAYTSSDRADRSLDRDWLAYRQSLARQRQAELQVEELDARISVLEKKRAEAAPNQ